VFGRTLPYLFSFDVFCRSVPFSGSGTVYAFMPSFIAAFWGLRRVIWWLNTLAFIGNVVTRGQLRAVGSFGIGELVRGRNTGSHALAVVNHPQPQLLSLENSNLRTTNTFIHWSVYVRYLFIDASKQHLFLSFCLILTQICNHCTDL